MEPACCSFGHDCFYRMFYLAVLRNRVWSSEATNVEKITTPNTFHKCFYFPLKNFNYIKCNSGLNKVESIPTCLPFNQYDLFIYGKDVSL